MPAFEVEWWRCKGERERQTETERERKMPKKRLVFKAERSCTSVFSVSGSTASVLQAAAARGRNRENQPHEHGGLKLPLHLWSSVGKGALKSSFGSVANLI